MLSINYAAAMKGFPKRALSPGSEFLFGMGVTLVEILREKDPASPPHCAILLAGVVAVIVGLAETDIRSEMRNREADERPKGTPRDSHGNDLS